MNRESKGTLFAVITAVISGFAIITNKILIVPLEPIIFTSVRALIVGVIFFFLAYFNSDFKPKKIKKVPWRYLVAIGIIGGGLAFFLYFSGLKLTTGGRAAFLHKTLPIYVTVLAYIFLKEKVTQKQVAFLTLMLAGMLLIYSSQISPSDLWQNPSVGDLLVILGTILWGVENVLARKAMLQGQSNWIVTFARMFIGGVFLFLILVFIGNLNALLALTVRQVSNILLSTSILLFYVFFWYKAVELINVSKAVSFLLLSPVISLLLGIIVLGEPAPFQQIVGSALILLGAYFTAKVKSELMTGV